MESPERKDHDLKSKGSESVMNFLWTTAGRSIFYLEYSTSHHLKRWKGCWRRLSQPSVPIVMSRQSEKAFFFAVFVLVEMKNGLVSEILLNNPLCDRPLERVI